MKTNRNFRMIFIFILFLVISFVITSFFSNRILRIFFFNKIWAHKVNRIEQLHSVKNKFSGVEFDVVFYTENRFFDVNHPPDPSINLSISEYLNSQNVNELKYWIDFKNLNEENALISLQTLDSIITLSGIIRNNVIVESMRPEYLKSFQNKGFRTSYYLPQELNKLDVNSLNRTIEQIKKNLNTYNINYISTSYDEYTMIRKKFPNSKKLIWFTHYGSKNKISGRILLYKILLDKNVEVLLMPVAE